MEHQSSLGSHRRIPARETKEPSAADGAKKSLAEIGKCTNSGTGGMTRSGVRRKGGRSAKSPRAAPLTAQRRSEASAAAAAASILALRRGVGGVGLKRVHKGCISLSLRWRQSFGIEVTKRELGGRGEKRRIRQRDFFCVAKLCYFLPLCPLVRGPFGEARRDLLPLLPLALVLGTTDDDAPWPRCTFSGTLAVHAAPAPSNVPCSEKVSTTSLLAAKLNFCYCTVPGKMERSKPQLFLGFLRDFWLPVFFLMKRVQVQVTLVTFPQKKLFSRLARLFAAND